MQKSKTDEEKILNFWIKNQIDYYETVHDYVFSAKQDFDWLYFEYLEERKDKETWDKYVDYYYKIVKPEEEEELQKLQGKKHKKNNQRNKNFK